MVAHGRVDILMGPARNAALTLRPMLPDDAPGLAAIFVASIEDLTGDDYDSNQQAAWSAGADDVESFGRRLQGDLTLVVSLGGHPVGFASLKGRDHIAMLYVAPAAVGQGCAATLCDALEKLAAARGATTVMVDASDTAQGFFAKRGYQAKLRKTVPCGDEWLGSTAMEKALGTADDRKAH